jgi:uncharacterized protein YxjI
VTDPGDMRTLLEVHQRITPLVNRYQVFAPGADGLEPVAFVQQKRMALREEFGIFRDEAQSDVLARVKARSVIDVGATFDVRDPAGAPLGAFRKDFGKSLLKSTWHAYAADGDAPVATVFERSTAVALSRRAWNLVPLVGDLPFPIKFHFFIQAGDEVVGECRKTATVRDRYALSVRESHVDLLDRRAWIALTILLDAMQSR